MICSPQCAGGTAPIAHTGRVWLSGPSPTCPGVPAAALTHCSREAYHAWPIKSWWWRTKPPCRETLALNLRMAGYKVITADDGALALDMAREHQPDLVILDLMLPEMDGLTVCRTLRRSSQTPILILTARTGEMDKVVGLESGADDYLTKPFGLGELQARIRALLRRAGSHQMREQLQAGNLSLNLTSRRAFRDDKELSLSPKEFNLLVELIRNQGAVLSRDLLLARLWGYDYYGDAAHGGRTRPLAARENRGRPGPPRSHRHGARHRLPFRGVTGLQGERMKIIAIVGSGRKHGNTDQIVGLVETEMARIAAEKRVPLELETIYLGQQNISSCRGCHACFYRGEDKCPSHDDLLDIKARMKAADGLLLASPVYVDDVSGLTKTLIDRLAHICHRPEMAGRCAYIIATVGSSPTRHTLGTMGMAMRTWGYHLAGKAGFKMGALMDPQTSAARFTPARRADRVNAV